jgi:transcriptional regulator with XRE-family HTH domain
MGRPASTKKDPISETIVGLREHLGETQQQFAHRIGTSTPIVGRWETNHNPSAAVLRKLYDCSLEVGYQLGVDNFGAMIELSETMRKMAQRRVEMASAANQKAASGILHGIWKRVSTAGPANTKEELLSIIEHVAKDTLKLADRIVWTGRNEFVTEQESRGEKK